jgi:hypothetical protein
MFVGYYDEVEICDILVDEQNISLKKYEKLKKDIQKNFEKYNTQSLFFSSLDSTQKNNYLNNFEVSQNPVNIKFLMHFYLFNKNLNKFYEFSKIYVELRPYSKRLKLYNILSKFIKFIPSFILNSIEMKLRDYK